jgi:hypothetical protein
MTEVITSVEHIKVAQLESLQQGINLGRADAFKLCRQLLQAKLRAEQSEADQATEQDWIDYHTDRAEALAEVLVGLDGLNV